MFKIGLFCYNKLIIGKKSGDLYKERAMNGQYGDDFAFVYDSLMREDYSYGDYADYIEAVFARFGKPPEPFIADLGCGAGSMCVELASRGYDMIGIDNSPHMLAMAREKAAASGCSEKILFLEQELGAFELYGTVGAFISTFDCLNYITDKRRLRALFRLAGNYLAPGGFFIFDLNTPYKLEKLVKSGVFYEVTDDFCYIWQNRAGGAGGTGGANRKVVFDMTFFTKEQDGRWRRQDEIHRQRAWLPGDIAHAARGTRLETLGIYSFLGFRRPRVKAAKASYIMKKTE